MSDTNNANNAVILPKYPRVQAKLNPAGQAQYWTADEMAALHAVLAEKDARIAELERKLFFLDVILDVRDSANVELEADNERLRGACQQAREALSELIGADYDVAGDIALLDAALGKEAER